jgi:hypothetical protein
MTNDFTTFLENIAHGILRLLGQTVFTFRDMFCGPRRFARLVGTHSEPAEYVGPYTFLIVAGYLGVMVPVSILTWLSLFNQQFNFTVDTLNEELSVASMVLRLPTLKEALLIGMPLVIAIHLLGRSYRYAITVEPNARVEQVLYYTTGLQYLALSIVLFVANVLFWSDSPLSQWVLSALGSSFHLVLIALLIALPTYLLTTLAKHSVDAESRRFRRFFTATAGTVALFVTLVSLLLPAVGLGLYIWTHPLDLKERALLRLALIDEGAIQGDRITVGVLLTNQSDKQLVLISQSTILTMPGEISSTGWEGRLFDPDSEADAVVMAPRTSHALRFVGKNSGTRGMTNEAKGRLELHEIKANGSRAEVTVHAWESTKVPLPGY